jgi:hypothetical protein
MAAASDGGSVYGRLMRKKLREWLLAVVIAIVAIEVGIQAAVRLGYADFSLPSYSLAHASPFWQVLSPDFGNWHPSNAQYSHRKTCYDHIYRSNSHGMRDAEAPIASSSPRVVVLGDSFTEGYAVPDGRRYSERLEAATDVRFLNFGVAGFGSTQAYLLYKTLASKFDHSAVILAIVPTLDFHRNTPSEPALRQGAQYRPFLVGQYPNYEVRYPEGGFAPGYEWRKWATVILSEYWLTFRSRFHIGALLQDRLPDLSNVFAQLPGFRLPFGRPEPRSDIESAYLRYSPEGFMRLRYIIEQVKAIAGDRPMLVFSIPLTYDYKRVAAAKVAPPLTAELRALARKIGVEYIDILEATNGTDWHRFYPECDEHWSEQGHQAAADLLSRWRILTRGASDRVTKIQ